MSAPKSPVLALPVGGIPELMPHGAGLLTERDPVYLAKLILTYRDPAKRHPLLDVQTRHAERYLSHEAGFQKLLAFYKEITTSQPIQDGQSITSGEPVTSSSEVNTI
ncbi:MAG: hypothetical protein EOO39_29775 [Cytophagaceae bacterium]|nr:MAG: hypothetical protein EOO39_29775 [Cytophagaceae bacterium]